MTDEQEHSNLPIEGGTITSVEQVLRKRGYYLIYLDHAEDAALTLHEDIVVRYKLLKGTVLSEAAIEDVQVASERHQAYMLAVAYLGARARTAKEIERYLLRKEVQPELIAQVVERLENDHFIDDQDYAMRFAGTRLRLQNKGSRRIKQELIQRGVAKRVAAAAVDSLDEEAELQAAVRVAAKKWPYLKGEDRERKRKLMMFLLRRGYPHPIVKQAMTNVTQEVIEDDDSQMLDN
ncbi:RecX family transcriptional regulator [Paenibacillus daejeonensis]|uniref:RecX family transcriptional regulator n=1 Tax=Paenibacillus daejeonensis TaxID=135193 RepID=UPI000381089E|nr:RecX family transcriptional regulator [Paenibacillus daejeonensis]